jgi:hypothetical protein
MKFILFAICIIILFVIKKKVFAKIDREEEEALRTPGRANFIRDNYPEVVDYLLSIQNYQIIFERTDMIQIGTSKSGEYYAVSNYSGGLFISFIRHSNVYKEWKFSRRENVTHIIHELKSIK